MSTRSVIELYNGDPNGEHDEHPSALLYRHSDGYPSWMLPDLTKRLRHALKVGYWSDAQRIAAMLVAWSIGDYERPDLNPDHSLAYAYAVKRAKENGKKTPDKKANMWGVPFLQPAMNYPSDIEFLYRVYLHSGDKFSIVAYAIGSGWWDETPEVPAPEDRLLKLELTAKGLLKSCPVCGLKYTSKKIRDNHYCSSG